MTHAAQLPWSHQQGRDDCRDIKKVEGMGKTLSPGDKCKIAGIDPKALPENHTHERMSGSLVAPLEPTCTGAMILWSDRGALREGEADTITRPHRARGTR